ncbi:insulinase family protein [Vibrio aestuarianus]|uniref:insulinase family protein n=1 Tax=Vibrio aestuarianus TaxID=28171 RepID=UPI0021C39EF1|nr:insulinase family protein [Vibrio aestuarianus]MDE1209796.1 insulinase family protein [Vibrio aestuarianus]MDE1252793.1 insulinase family protein [Vibrio aestuarianus]MDE1316900.1 insulinase family protein [Vibrio aestuarianus]CAH8202535.1 Pitrilysin [Vibrio aestuarianus]
MHLSPNDTHHYRYVTLTNGLRTLLIQADDAQKSAAALAVNVGHFDDPSDREGLAHYLEHMLFLGTEKYPKVGEFQSFISQHGGSNNAWTGTEHTCFFFDVSPNTFEKALDRFSQFFCAPLFNEEALDKERQAVDSEFKLKLNDDSRRLYQVQKETINPAHPFAKFSVGNLDTLCDRNDVSIREEIVQFHNQHYSADLMTLALSGPHSLDELEQLAEEKFSSILNQQLGHKSVSEPFVLEEHTGVFIQIEPLKELRKLILSFPAPSMDDFYEVKPLSYFAHLLGYEGEGSLMLALKEKGWITSLSAGGGASGSNYREFSVSFSLTREGLNHIEVIIQALFTQISLIAEQGLDEWRYNEKRAVLESAFRFQETTRPLDMVSHLVVNMQHYKPQDTIYGDYMMAGYDEQLLRQMLSYLTPRNLRATLVAKGGAYGKHVKWYSTPYSVTPFSDSQLALFSTPIDIANSLPPKNPFISYDLDPKDLEPSQSEYPEIIEELPGFRLWHLQDREFRVPKGVIYIAIDSPISVANPSNIVKTRLCVEMFLDSLAKETYQAEIAGMNYNMYAHQGGVTLTISGFSQKQPQLMKMILERFAKRDFSESRFKTIKQQLLRNWRNTTKDRPISQIFNAMTGIFQPNNPPHPVLLEALKDIKLEELRDFVDQILAQLHVEMFVYGDWLRKDAQAMAETLKNALRVKDQQYEESLRPLIMLGKNGTFQREVHCDQEDSAVVVYYQCDDTSARNIALYSLANHLMSATFFHEIRTKQQLGYMVGTGNMPLNRHPGIVLYVQSPNAAPSELITAVDEFLNAFYMVLLELNEYQWHSSKRGLWNQISAPDPTLRSRAQRLWVAIGNKDAGFDQRELVLEELKLLSRSDMIRFIVNELKPRTANRLIMHSQGNAHHDAETLSLGQEIGSIEEFQLRPKDCDLG